MGAEQYLVDYYAQNAKKLRALVDKILRNFGTVPDPEHFYSLVNEVFVDVMRRYDESLNFDVFLYSCMCNRIKTEFTRMNRQKRGADRTAISIYTPLSEDAERTLIDLIVSDYDLEREVIGECDIRQTKMELYLQSLSARQRKIVEMLAEDYKPGEIKDFLHITEKQYVADLEVIHSYENVSILL